MEQDIPNYQNQLLPKMDLKLYTYNPKLNNLEVAHEILQIYLESLQDHNKLLNILSEYSILDYFGKSYYGPETVCSHLMANLYGSGFELSSLTTGDTEPTINWEDFIHKNKASQTDDELGVNLMSTPTSSFPGLTFSTPIRPVARYYRNSEYPSHKRSSLDSGFNYLYSRKKYKFDLELCRNGFMEGQLMANNGTEISSKSFRIKKPGEMRFLSSLGTICYSKNVLSTFDPKIIKYHRAGTPRDRFCHLYIGFQCDEHFISVTNCKIWIIKYGISSKVTPRNLLNSFNESDCN